MANRDLIADIVVLASDIEMMKLWEWVRFHSGERKYSPDTFVMHVMKNRSVGTITLPVTVTRK